MWVRACMCVCVCVCESGGQLCLFLCKGVMGACCVASVCGCESVGGWLDEQQLD